MSRWGDDFDGIYERDEREMPEHETAPPRDPLPPAIDYEPVDWDEEAAVVHYADMVSSECLPEREAERAYRAFVRRHRRGES